MAGEWKKDTKKDLARRAEGNAFKLKEQENVFRILANKRGDAYKPYVTYAQHIVGPKNRFVRCGLKANGTGECWLCQVKIPALQNSEKRNLRELAEKMMPRETVLVQVAYIEDGRWFGPKPMYLSLGKRKAFGNRLLAFIASGTKAYDSLTAGYNLVVEKTGQGLKTEYHDIQAEDVPTKVPQGIIAKMKTFGEMVESYDKVTQQNAYLGKDDEPKGPEEEREPEESTEEVAPPSAKTSKKLAAPVEEPEPVFEPEGEKWEEPGLAEEGEPVEGDDYTEGGTTAEDAEFETEVPVEEEAGEVYVEEGTETLEDVPAEELEPEPVPVRGRPKAKGKTRTAAPEPEELVEVSDDNIPDPGEESFNPEEGEESFEPGAEEEGGFEQEEQVPEVEEGFEEAIVDEPPPPPVRKPKPVAKPAAKPAVASARPVARPAGKSVAQPVRRPVAPPARPATKPAARPATRPVVGKPKR